MCLIKNHRFPKISFKPIKVFKLVYSQNGIYYSWFMQCPIYLGKSLRSKKHWIKGIFAENITSEGVHAYLEKPQCGNYYINTRVLEAEIPPFTPYWIGWDNEVAAAKLRIIREIDV